MNIVKNEDPATYTVSPTAGDDAVISQAMSILAGRMRSGGDVFASPTNVRSYCQLRLGGLNHEVFAVLFLNVQNSLIEYREMFRGTLTQTSVYPREVVKEALELNAAGVVLVHNHPSGNTQPSRADEAMTQTLKGSTCADRCPGARSHHRDRQRLPIDGRERTHMTPSQFGALATLAGMSYSASRRAAALVLVNGLTQARAAAKAGISVQGVSQALQRIKRAQRLVADAK